MQERLEGKKLQLTLFKAIYIFLFHEENIKRRFCDLLVSMDMTKSKTQANISLFKVKTTVHGRNKVQSY